MKKILLIVVLLVIVYFISTTISDAVEGRNQTAQALPSTTVGGVQISILGNKIKVHENKTKIAIVGDLKIKTAQKTSVTFLPPKVLKDGQPYTIATSSFRLDAALMIKRMIWIPGPRFVGPTFEVKKGNNTYRMQWTVNKSALPPGSYQFAFGDFMVGTSTTTGSMPPVWSKTVVVTPAISTVLDGGDYKLISYNGIVFTGTDAPLIAFRNGRVRVKICNLMEGSYSLNNTNLNISRLVGTEMACGNNYLNQLEQKFSAALASGAWKVSISGDYLTIASNRNMHTFVFMKYIPTPTTITATSSTSSATRVYPCNFVGPLEPGAVRDCPGVIGN